MDGLTGDPLFILDSQRGSDNNSLCKVYWISYCGVFSKWTLSFRYHCHLVEYPTMPLNLQNPLCIHVSSINASIDLSSSIHLRKKLHSAFRPCHLNLGLCWSSKLKRRDLNIVTFTFIEKEYSIYLLHLHVFQNKPKTTYFKRRLQ